MITLQDISFSYPDSAETLFDGFSVTLGGTSRWTCIAGTNGCGKTTLLKLIAGIIPPLSGIIQCDPAVYCAQNSTELPDTVYASFWDADNETRRFFSLLGVAPEQLDRWETLSGGEKKRLQIACALAEHPSVLLLDEPTNHLDILSVRLLETSLAEISCALLIVSHDSVFLQACNCTELWHITGNLSKMQLHNVLQPHNINSFLFIVLRLSITHCIKEMKMKKLSMTILFAAVLIVYAASLTAEGNAKSDNETAPADTTYTVRGVNFTMKGIAALISIRDTVLALKGASPQMNEFIEGLLPKEDAAAFTDEKMRIGTVPLIQVEQAQKHILQTYLCFLQAEKEGI